MMQEPAMTPMNDFDAHVLIRILPELIVIVSALVLLLLGAFRGNKATPAICFAATALIALACYWLSFTLQTAPTSLFHGLFVTDKFSQYVKLLLMISTVLVLALSYDWLHRTNNSFEYPVLMMLSLVGMMIMVSANDFLTLYMGLELSALALYVLASFDRDQPLSSEAGLKYFILGALASGMMLFGVSLIYGYTGTTNFEAISMLYGGGEGEEQIPVAYGAVIGMVLLTVGFCFKISAVPFHMWTPDVYTGAPTAVTMFFATAPKFAAMAVFIRVLMQPFEAMLPDWQNILALVANASMIVGALGAIMQTNLKRMLAYGSIGHIGYVLVGVAAATPDGLKAVMVYLTLYLFMSIGTFGYILLMRRDGRYVEDIADLAGLSKNSPAGALFLAIMMFSMAGIPPFAGFFGKMFVFLSAMEAGFYVLTIVGLLTSVVAAYYYLKVIKVMYFDASAAPFDKVYPKATAAVLIVCAVVTVGFFLLPDPLMAVTENAVSALM
jgi:NADH-quinone oxidoreductase subunit N